jgi:hypothetical protein
MIQDDLHGGGGFNRSSNEIEADIRQTRSRMDTTLDELGERLSARYILNTALDWWECRTTAARSQGVVGAKAAGKVLSRQIKEHPMPSVLIGAGIAWLLFKNDEPEGSDSQGYAKSSWTGYGPTGPIAPPDEGAGMAEKMKQKASAATGAVKEAAGTVSDKLSDFAQATGESVENLREAAREKVRSAGETAHDLTNDARQALDRGRKASREFGHRVHENYDVSMERVRRGMNEYPLAAGLGFAALGALLGLFLPHTRREDEILGEHSDQLINTVKEQGRDLIERGKVVAERVAETALAEAQNQGLTPESAGEAISGLAAKAGEVLHKAKEEAVREAEEQGLTPSPSTSGPPSCAPQPESVWPG